MKIIENIEFLESEPFTRGGFAALYKALLFSKGRTTSKIVVVKVPDKYRIVNGQGAEWVMERTKALERWRREIRAGQSVLHPNIVRILGFCNNPDPANKEFIGIIIPYCENGNVSSYIQVHPEVDRLRILVLVGAALFALHDQSPPVVHGDIKAMNILIDDQGNPLLADFGLSRVCGTKGYTTKTILGSTQWMAPELLHALTYGPQYSTSGEQVHHTTKASDVWAFSMTILEILTGDIPFAGVSNAGVLVGVVSRKARPERPRDPQVSDALWILLQSCWAEDPSERPDACHVGLILDLIYGFNGKESDASIVSVILGGGFDDALPQSPSSGRSRSHFSLLPYACKWLNCSQAFGSIIDCVAHECEEFKMRARR